MAKTAAESALREHSKSANPGGPKLVQAPFENVLAPGQDEDLAEHLPMMARAVRQRKLPAQAGGAIEPSPFGEEQVHRRVPVQGPLDCDVPEDADIEEWEKEVIGRDIVFENVEAPESRAIPEDTQEAPVVPPAMSQKAVLDDVPMMIRKTHVRRNLNDDVPMSIRRALPVSVPQPVPPVQQSEAPTEQPSSQTPEEIPVEAGAAGDSRNSTSESGEQAVAVQVPLATQSASSSSMDPRDNIALRQVPKDLRREGRSAALATEPPEKKPRFPWHHANVYTCLLASGSTLQHSWEN